MVEKKFSKFLTALLIIIAISIFVILGFWIYNFIQKYYINRNADKAINEFESIIGDLGDFNNQDTSDNVDGEAETGSGDSDSGSGSSTGSGSRSSRRRRTTPANYNYNGFNVIGKIEIPKTRIKYPVFDVATISSMKVSVGMVYGPGLNEVGNTVIMGHNYRNGTFFSNNSKLTNGDTIYITDAYGWRLRYTVYNVYVTSSSDFDYATRDTAGYREISLASCTNDSKSRVIIWAKAE